MSKQGQMPGQEVSGKDLSNLSDESGSDLSAKEDNPSNRMTEEQEDTSTKFEQLKKNYFDNTPTRQSVVNRSRIALEHPRPHPEPEQVQTMLFNDSSSVEEENKVQSRISVGNLSWSSESSESAQSHRNEQRMDNSPRERPQRFRQANTLEPSIHSRTRNGQAAATRGVIDQSSDVIQTLLREFELMRRQFTALQLQNDEMNHQIRQRGVQGAHEQRQSGGPIRFEQPAVEIQNEHALSPVTTFVSESISSSGASQEHRQPIANPQINENPEHGIGRNNSSFSFGQWNTVISQTMSSSSNAELPLDRRPEQISTFNFDRRQSVPSRRVTAELVPVRIEPIELASEEPQPGVSSRRLNEFVDNIEERKTPPRKNADVDPNDFFAQTQREIEQQLVTAALTPVVKKRRQSISSISFNQDQNTSVQQEQQQEPETTSPSAQNKRRPARQYTSKSSKNLKLEVVNEERSSGGSSSSFTDRTPKTTPPPDLQKSNSRSMTSGQNDSEEFSEIKLDSFEQFKKYSGEGIITDSKLQKQIVDFCVKLGVDPKSYSSLFSQIQRFQTMTEPLAFNRAGSLSVKTDESPDETLQSVSRRESNNTQRLMQQLLRQTTKQLEKQQDGPSLRWCHIQILIITKRLQEFFDEDSKRIAKMNHLQNIIIQQHSRIRSLKQLHMAEQKNLHFAFMFACPLALSFLSNNETKLQIIAQLNHRKEFQIIKQRLSESKAMISITSQQCTIESLQEILRSKPLGIHFSGHGVENTYQNVGEAHYQHKNEGDFLLLETMEGDGRLVSRQRLQNLINSSCCKLKFVVVATCHSEFVGRIFLDAGAEHVVCIRKQDKVADEAVLHFTNTFYSAVFSQKEPICKAFDYAMLSVKINHSAKEADVFQLLRQKDRESGKPKQEHSCHVFGPFPLGNYQFKEPFNVTFKTQLPRLTDLVGRQKDMYQLLQEIMNVSKHLHTVIGLPGVGKSALIKSTLQYIQDRCLKRGGIIYTDARSNSNCEIFVHKLNQQLIQENPILFGSDKHRGTNSQQDSLNTFMLILNKIKDIKEEILMVIDNCEDIIENDRQNFKVLISIILAQIPSIKVLLTTRVRLGAGVKEANEEIFVLSGLNNQQTESLLRRKLSRPITIAEQNALMKTQPDYERYPQEKGLKQTKLHEHHFFKLLGGNPQSIILIAPLLGDPLKNIQLVDLYKILTSNMLYDILESEQIEDQMMASLRLSVHVSVKMIDENDVVSMQLFLVLGLLPGGITIKELDSLWDLVKKCQPNLQKKNLKKLPSIQEMTSNLASEDTWAKAKQKLLQNSLIEEVQIEQKQTEKKRRQTIKKVNKRPSTMEISDDDSDDDSQEEETKTPLIKDVKIQMPQYVCQFSQAMISEEEVQCYQTVLAVYFFERLQRLYQENAIAGVQNSQQFAIVEEINESEQNLIAFIQRMKDSRDQVGNQWFAPSKSQKHQLKFKLPTQAMKKSTSSMTPISNNLTFTELTRWSSNMEMMSPRTPQQLLSDEQRNEYSLVNQQWSGLYESYQQIVQENKKQKLANEFIERVQRNSFFKPNRSLFQGKEWVRLMWRWCFKKVMKNREIAKNTVRLKHTTTKIFVSNDIDEDDDRNEEDNLKKIEAMNQHKFDKANLPVRRDQSGKLAYFRQATNLKNDEQISPEEKVVIYYIANLILLQRYPMVRYLYDSFLKYFTNSSKQFKANINRYMGLALLNDAANIDANLFNPNEFLDQLVMLLEEAYLDFESTDNEWGMGLIKYMQGCAYIKLSQSANQDNRQVTVQCFTEALELFQKAKNYRGCILSGEKLIELQAGTESINTFDKDERSDIEQIITDNTMELLIAEQRPNQKVFFKRTPGEEFSLLTDIIDTDFFSECNKLSRQMSAIPKKAKKRLSQRLQTKKQDQQRTNKRTMTKRIMSLDSEFLDMIQEIHDISDDSESDSSSEGESIQDGSTGRSRS